MSRFNVSAWGVRNGALTLFAMILLAAPGRSSAVPRILPSR
jgi:hypothetical protein